MGRLPGFAGGGNVNPPLSLRCSTELQVAVIGRSQLRRILFQISNILELWRFRRDALARPPFVGARSSASGVVSAVGMGDV